MKRYWVCGCCECWKWGRRVGVGCVSHSLWTWSHLEAPAGGPCGWCSLDADASSSTQHSHHRSLTHRQWPSEHILGEEEKNRKKEKKRRKKRKKRVQELTIAASCRAPASPTSRSRSPRPWFTPYRASSSSSWSSSWSSWACPTVTVTAAGQKRQNLKNFKSFWNKESEGQGDLSS